MCKIANAFKEAGIKKGDAVTVYMPMIPEVTDFAIVIDYPE